MGVEQQPHVITTVEASDSEIVRECWCGWVTVGSIPEPPHHIPLPKREQDHLAEAARIADGSIWQVVPRRHSYELFLRRRLRDQTPNQVVVRAVWIGGFQDVLIWPWTPEGLAEAQAWCDQPYVTVTWARTKDRDQGGPVLPGELVDL